MLGAALGSHVSQIRTYALVAAIVIILWLFLQSMSVTNEDLQDTKHRSLEVINKFVPDAWRTYVPRVTKVTTLFGHENDLYEAALRSHDEHNRINGYDVKVLREKIVDSYWSKPAYLLSLIVDELAKPEGERTEWLMWHGPDVILLNPHIPLELFLPPTDFDHIHFLGTHDIEGLNCGVFFLHVHEWSVKMLIEILSLPRDHPGLQGSTEKDELSMELVLTGEHFRGQVSYQPRTWYNAYQLSATDFEGKRGDLLVHFHDLEGDKWSAMASTLSEVSQSNSTWRVPLGMTTYESEVAEYWEKIRKSWKLIDYARDRMHEEAVNGAAKRLEYAINYEADLEQVMNKAMDSLKASLGIKEGWPF